MLHSGRFKMHFTWVASRTVRGGCRCKRGVLTRRNWLVEGESEEVKSSWTGWGVSRSCWSSLRMLHCDLYLKYWFWKHWKRRIIYDIHGDESSRRKVRTRVHQKKIDRSHCCFGPSRCRCCSPFQFRLSADFNLTQFSLSSAHHHHHPLETHHFTSRWSFHSNRVVRKSAAVYINDVEI